MLDDDTPAEDDIMSDEAVLTAAEEELAVLLEAAPELVDDETALCTDEDPTIVVSELSADVELNDEFKETELFFDDKTVFSRAVPVQPEKSDAAHNSAAADKKTRFFLSKHAISLLLHYGNT